MTAKSIAYIVKMFPRLSETFILNEILILESMGLKIRIISLQRSDSKVFHQGFRSVQAQTYYIPVSFWRELPHMLRAQAHFLARHSRRWAGAFTSMVFRFSLKAIKHWLQAGIVAELLEGTDIGHIHAHFSNAPTAVTMTAAMLLDISYSVTCHAKDVYAGARLYSPKFFRNLSRAEFVVCVSARTKQDILNAWPKLSPEKIYVIYNGLDLERFRRRSTEPTDHLILSVGRLVEKKGLSYLIEACQLLKKNSVHFKCDIVGDGELENSLSNLISNLKLGDQVRLVGPLSQEDLIQYYQNAYVFCLPTNIADNQDRDVLPNVVKEAMAVGVPVVTTSIPAMEELVENDHTGLLVPPRNPQALAEALKRLLDNGEQARRFAESGRQVIEVRFDRRKNVSQLLKLLERYIT
jgi:glycosyltransferase involved in cell wall biosynthesis